MQAGRRSPTVYLVYTFCLKLISKTKRKRGEGIVAGLCVRAREQDTAFFCRSYLLWKSDTRRSNAIRHYTGHART
jgi:hypothetical protein